jgi:hypothetical protein
MPGAMRASPVDKKRRDNSRTGLLFPALLYRRNDSIKIFFKPLLAFFGI